MSFCPRAILLIALVGAASSGCSSTPPEKAAITQAWSDTFDRDGLGDDWYATAPNAYTLTDGVLTARGAYNHPLWLRKPLPANAVIELDVWSNSPTGDIKVEMWGDGKSFAADKGQYTASGYVAIFGGWSNSVSVLVAGNEHRADRPERKTPKVEVGRHYHWKISKRGDVLEWYVDADPEPFLRYQGPELSGPNHRFFAINNWESDCGFDNLTITPL